jgi:hypothetical protein
VKNTAAPIRLTNMTGTLATTATTTTAGAAVPVRFSRAATQFFVHVAKPKSNA